MDSSHPITITAAVIYYDRTGDSVEFTAETYSDAVDFAARRLFRRTGCRRQIFKRLIDQPKGIFLITEPWGIAETILGQLHISGPSETSNSKREP